MKNTDFRIRSVPSVTNPTPRPSTPGRPGTSSGLKNLGFSSGGVSQSLDHVSFDMHVLIMSVSFSVSIHFFCRRHYRSLEVARSTSLILKNQSSLCLMT